ncbi:MAG: polyphosphate polymerase domain-containing protein [Butyrivibrio sp.]|nr:polyphosphate polymerase domain-containing protein [Butyrivibrio sp.]
MGEVLVNVYRSEWKFYISLSEYYYLKSMLELVMTPDPNMGDRGEYYIRSLYFDSVDNMDYMTKMAGVENRKKIRLRIYDTSDDNVKLEVKNRYNSYMLKESLVIPKPDALCLINGEFEVLDKYEKKTAKKVRNLMENYIYSPKTIVDYEREAFIYPEHNVRVTFDKNIRGAASDSLFDPCLGMTPLLREPVMVLEVKYNQVLPRFIKDAISSGRLLNSSISKYCMARELLG